MGNPSLKGERRNREGIETIRDLRAAMRDCMLQCWVMIKINDRTQIIHWVGFPGPCEEEGVRAKTGVYTVTANSCMGLQFSQMSGEVVLFQVKVSVNSCVVHPSHSNLLRIKQVVSHLDTNYLSSTV